MNILSIDKTLSCWLMTGTVLEIEVDIKIRYKGLVEGTIKTVREHSGARNNRL